MIPKRYLEKDWIEHLDNEMRYAQKELIERTLYAFELLAELTRLDQDFVFKGGTSLLLILPDMRRLSIDIDIVGTLDEKEILKLPEKTVFTDVEKEDRGDRPLPTKHFKFKYYSEIQGREMPILLDMLEIKSEYETVEEKELSAENPGLFELDEDVFVTVPDVENILADKLTAFAPETIGIHHYDRKNNPRSLEIVKQLYDVGELFDFTTNLRDIRSVYEKIRKREASYRDTTFSLKDCLEDTLDISRKIALLNFEDVEHVEEVERIAKSMEGLGQYVARDKYTLGDATISTGKAALLVSLILTENEGSLEEYRYKEDSEDNHAHFEMKEPFSSLEKLSVVNREAYYYWSQAVRILQKENLLN